MTDAADATSGVSSGHRSVPDVVIRASAGTGKTFQLSNRYLRQLLDGSAPDEVLATTFTRKAAGEILERNLVRLAEAALGADKCRELGGFLDDTSLTRDRCLQLIQRLTRGLHRIRICTLDSFFSQIASSFGFEMGLPPDWTIVDEIEDVRLRNRAVEAVLRNETTSDAVQLMHLLTKGDADRSVSELIRQTVTALYPIFLETDANAWSAFPKARVLSKDDLSAAIEELRTVPLPPDKRFETARNKDFENACSDDWDAFVSGGLAAKIAEGTTTYYRKEIPDAAIQTYTRLLNHSRAVLVDLVARQTQATWQLLSRFDVRYSQLKDDARVLRFDDVTSLLAGIASSHDTGRLSFRMDGRISHILLDEFQDTSLAQWQVIRPFAEQVTDKSPDRSFFCVGDGKQAIYGWRGGVAEIFDAIEDQLPGLDRQTLNKSYRSAPPVVTTTNHIFNGLRQHADPDDDGSSITKWCEQFQDHSTARTELTGYACLETSPAAEEASGQSDVTISHAAARIAELSRRSPQYTIGVLVRTNRMVGRLIYELRQLGVAASEEGGNPLTDSAAVQLIMSLLKLADHPGNTAARFHVAQSPLGAALQFFQFGNDQQAERLARHIRGRLQSEGYGPVLLEWAGRLSSLCGSRGRRRLSQLVELGYAWQRQATLRTAEFLNFLELSRVPDPTSDSVRVMTVHQSKGLEFDVVVLPDLDGRLIGQPSQVVVNKPSPTEPIDRVCRYRGAKVRELLPAEFQKMFDDARRTELSEALCVLYVAVTRAVHALYMIISPSRPSEKKLPKTTAGLLRAALTKGLPTEPSQVLYECGQQNWSESAANLPPQTESEAASASPPVASAALSFAAMPDGRSRGLQRTAPSRHQTEMKVRLSSVIRPGATKAMERGTLIHAWFEQIEWLDDGILPDEADLRTTAAQSGFSDSETDVLIGQFRTMLACPDIAAALSQSSYQPPHDLALSPTLRQQLKQAEAGQIRLEVWNEQSFAVRDGGEIMSGFIDRLVLIYLDNQLVACDVVDFKTDAVDDNDPSALTAKAEHYRPQLNAYRRVVSRLYDVPQQNISTRLFFVGIGKIANV